MADAAPELTGLPWTRPSTHAWTNAVTRALVLAWIRTYVSTRSWIQHPPDGPGWAVDERFSDRGLDSRVQTTPPYQPTDDAPFYQRPGVRVLTFSVTRARDRRWLSCSIVLPQGNETPQSEIARLLAQGATALDIEHRRFPRTRATKPPACG